VISSGYPYSLCRSNSLNSYLLPLWILVTPYLITSICYQPNCPHLAVGCQSPRTPIEQQLVAIWSQVLDLEDVGIDDPFLDLDGDSLQAMRIATRVEQDLSVQIPAHLLLQTPTVRETATRVIQTQMDRMDPTALADLLAEVEGTMGDG
jgi:acyl carrier protein